MIYFSFICTHLFHDKLLIFFEDYFVKYFTIYCDSKEDLDFKNKLKEPNTQFSPQSSYPRAETILQSVKRIDQIDQMNNLFFYYIITEYNKNNLFVCTEECYNKFVNQPKFHYDIDPQILIFLNTKLNLINNPNISKEFITDYIKDLYILELEVNQQISKIKTLYLDILYKVGNGLIDYFTDTIISWFEDESDTIMDIHYEKVQDVIQHFEKKSEQIFNLQPRVSKDERLKALLEYNKIAPKQIFGYNSSNASTSSINSIDSQKTIEHKKNNYPLIKG